MPKHALPILVAAAVFAMSEIFVAFPSLFYIIVATEIALVAASVWYLAQGGSEVKKWWPYGVLPVLWVASSSLFLGMLKNGAMIHALVVASGVIIFLNLGLVYYNFHRLDLNVQADFDNFAAYSSFLTMFFVTGAGFGLMSFLDLSVWLVLLCLVVAYLLIIFQLLYINRIEDKSRWLFSLIDAFILLELAWALSFLPLTFSVTGLVLAVYYYILIGLTRYFLSGTLNRRVIKFYLAFGLSCTIIALLTAKWK